MNRINYYQQIPQKYYVGGAKKVSQNRPRRAVCASIFCILLFVMPALANRAVASSVATSSGAVSSDARVVGLIEQLRSDDAATRQSAASALIAIGDPARPAILKLIRSQDPGLRQEAAQILLKLPWSVPEDPPPVKQLLLRYGTPDVDQRREVVRDLAQLDRGEGLQALPRLLADDPSPAVQWTIVRWLREVGNLQGLRTFIAPADNSRMLALCGYAKRSFDTSAAMDDLRRCAELEFTDPADDGGEFDFVIRALADNACEQKQFDQAADWRRRELVRGSISDQAGVQVALLELFALQADFGPIKGLDSDIRLAGDDILKPKLQYALARLYRRTGATAKADVAQHTAFAASTSRMQRYDVGDFLSSHEWDDFAESELTAYLKMDSLDGGIDSRQEDANVYLRLAGLAVARDDDLTAAHDKEQAMLLLGKDTTDLTREDGAGHRWPVPPSAIWAEIYWRYLRAAAAQHNDAETDRRLEQLMQLKPTDSDIAIDVVPLLHQRGRDIDANLMFQWAYDDLKKGLDANPADAEKMNGLAWLCAKCDRNLQDARAWADKAAALVPDNAAILDTQAEVNFHLGRFDEAVRLETAASKLQPEDAFMKKQLERFMAAAKHPTTRP